MARFQFRLKSLLNYRESLRDQCRQVLAQWLARDANLAAQETELILEREQQLSEIRAEQNQNAPLNVDRLSNRRYRAGQLTVDMQAIARQRQELAQQIALCRQALVKADQGVKVLEQLSEKQWTEYRAEVEKREARDREEIWQAGHWKEIGP